MTYKENFEGRERARRAKEFGCLHGVQHRFRNSTDSMKFMMTAAEIQLQSYEKRGVTLA
jgi:hypothetical protein